MHQGEDDYPPLGSVPPNDAPILPKPRFSPNSGDFSLLCAPMRLRRNSPFPDHASSPACAQRATLLSSSTPTSPSTPRHAPLHTRTSCTSSVQLSDNTRARCCARGAPAAGETPRPLKRTLPMAHCACAGRRSRRRTCGRWACAWKTRRTARCSSRRCCAARATVRPLRLRLREMTPRLARPAACPPALRPPAAAGEYDEWRCVIGKQEQTVEVAPAQRHACCMLHR